MSDAPTCDTCQHWQTTNIDAEGLDYPPYVYDDEKGRLDYRQRAAGEWGFCMKVAEHGPRHASRFYVIDGSEYLAKMGTRSDFGCVEHEHQPDA